MKYLYHKGDLPSSLITSNIVAVDTETTGLSPVRDRLCVVQICFGDDTAHIVQMQPGYDCPNLKAILADTNRLKLFHFGRFDIMMLEKYLGITCTPVYCTKIASKLVRTYTDRHGLKELAKELANVDLNKQQQSSDWAAEELTDEQLKYAASDVWYLHRIKEKLDILLERENRVAMAQQAFDFLPMRAHMDLAGFEDTDIFAHS